MLSVGLTGNVASGKSTVADAWRAAGVPVADADRFAREAVRPGSEGLAEVVEAFGPDVLLADGSLDREGLRRRVFGDDAARRRLEALLHPRIARLRESWLDARRAEGADLAVSEIPLLFEVGMEDAFDVVVLVDAPAEERLRRLVELRGLDPAEARRIMESQGDPGAKRARADHVLDNDGTVEALERKAEALLARLREGAGGDGAGKGGAPRLLRMDLHMHTLGSRDCLSDPEAVLEAAAARGVGRIALTDHDRLHVSLAMAERHPERVIAAEEVRVAEGIDLIGLYLTEEIPGGTPAEETIARIREQGGVVYLPHPYAPGKGGGGALAERLAPLADVIEVHNGRLHDPELNRKARELAERHGLPGGVGSDAHTVGEVARSWVEVPWHPNAPEPFLEALRHGRVHGHTAPHRVHLASTWAKVRHKLPGGPTWEG